MVIILDSETRFQDPLGSRWRWSQGYLDDQWSSSSLCCLLFDLYSNDDNGGDNADNADNDAYEDSASDFVVLNL